MSVHEEDVVLMEEPMRRVAHVSLVVHERRRSGREEESAGAATIALPL